MFLFNIDRFFICALLASMVACTSVQGSTAIDNKTIIDNKTVLTNQLSDNKSDNKTCTMYDLPEVQSFAKEIIKRNKLDEKIVINAFKNTVFDTSVTDLMDKPAEEKPWTDYSTELLSKERINMGLKYMEEYSSPLDNVSKAYNISPNVVTAIIGIESTYGKVTFKRTVVQSIGTIAFKYPRRAKYFKAELESLFIVAKKYDADPLSYYGSYAGAVGIAQFMPSNIIRFGKDGDGDGVVDIVNNHSDAIASVGYYLHKHGWKKGKEIGTSVTLSKELPSISFASSPCNSSARKTVGDLRKIGVVFPKNYADNTVAILSRLEEKKGVFTPVVFFENACPIHKYNSSTKYTAAIFMLAKTLETEEGDKEQKKTK